ncbi:hypothetical protein Bca101_024073 [Brassica carinata]
MKKLKSFYMQVRRHQQQAADRRWILPLAVGSICSLFLLFLTTLASSSSGQARLIPLSVYGLRSSSSSSSVFVESKINPLSVSVSVTPPPPPPRLAYLISGSSGDGQMLKRTLMALYHPNNQYVVHLDRESSAEERLDLGAFVANQTLFARFGNVRMIVKANFVTSHRAKPIIIDPGLYMSKKADVFWVSQKRSMPTAFKLFTGSAWMMLSRPFVDYFIWGWDNLPRIVLMYYANFLSSPEGYFHTVICNAKEFTNTTVNSDLHFISWDNPPKQHPHHLTLDDFNRMVDSNAPFARKFRRDEPVLDKIDSELLSRSPGMVTPGGWCIGTRENGSDPCAEIGDTSVVKPGPGAKRVEKLVTYLLSTENFRPRQCR